MTPPQVETALQAIEDSGDGAFYLRLHQGRYYASLDPSETRALASIRGAILQEQAHELLAATARKVVQANAGPFEVCPDVSAPADIPDKTRRPVLALVALAADQIDAEACITTAGPNRPPRAPELRLPVSAGNRARQGRDMERGPCHALPGDAAPPGGNGP